MDSIVILDFGSQYSQLIARRIRELQVFSEILPFDHPPSSTTKTEVKGYILSGGPSSVYETGSPQIPDHVLESRIPILGICYGMQALAHQLGGNVIGSALHEYGPSDIGVEVENPLIPIGQHRVWMSHGDRVETPPPGFIHLASSGNCPIAAFADVDNHWYGLQFHPEVQHTPVGAEIIRAFVLEVCQAQPSWSPDRIVEQAVESIRAQVGDRYVIAGVSGGVDSSVAASIVHQAVGDQLTAVFIDTGLLRIGEAQAVVGFFTRQMGSHFIAVDASETFLEALQNVTDPEAKRKIIGELFIRSFEEQARLQENAQYLVQGTIYPDVVESSGPGRELAARIKTHHNVGGLPNEMDLELIEPLRLLFKDEVRKVGSTLGLPDELIWRQPFPGPGLAVRCVGEVRPDRLERLKIADHIFQHELQEAGLLRNDTAQAFVVLLPVRAVGVMGDQRTHQETIVLRAVTTEDFMTADWARLSADLLAKVSNRITNEVKGINRVLYDITSKPPATIEWE